MFPLSIKIFLKVPILVFLNFKSTIAFPLKGLLDNKYIFKANSSKKVYILLKYNIILFSLVLFLLFKALYIVDLLLEALLIKLSFRVLRYLVVVISSKGLEFSLESINLLKSISITLSSSLVLEKYIMSL